MPSQRLGLLELADAAIMATPAFATPGLVTPMNGHVVIALETDSGPLVPGTDFKVLITKDNLGNYAEVPMTVARRA